MKSADKRKGVRKMSLGKGGRAKIRHKTSGGRERERIKKSFSGIRKDWREDGKSWQGKDHSQEQLLKMRGKFCWAFLRAAIPSRAFH